MPSSALPLLLSMHRRLGLSWEANKASCMMVSLGTEQRLASDAGIFS